MEIINKMNLKFWSKGENESFARLAVASFCSNIPFDVEEISDIKTAVSEGVTNAIVHGYKEDDEKIIDLVTHYIYIICSGSTNRYHKGYGTE